MKRIVIAGGTGFIGKHLTRALVSRGDQVTVLTRSTKQRHELPDSVQLLEWDPRADGDWQAVFEGKDAVVQLAGEVLVGRRHTRRRKQEFFASRVGSTECIVRGIERARHKPSVFVCGSAVGYYGIDRSHESVTEDAVPGDDFLAELCVAWEKAAERARASDVRVVQARIGIVLGAGGGALEKMALAFKLYAGGPIGSGQQMVSWVHMADATGILQQCIDDPDVSGPVNVTAPEPASNEALARAIAEALGKPSWLRVPAFALKLGFGEGAEPILGGQRALPDVMLRHGYEFCFRDVTSAVKQALGA